MTSPNLRQPNFSNFKNSHVTKVLIALVLEYAKVSFELLQVCTRDTRWRTTCSMWNISFFMATACGSQGLPISHLQINSSPSKGLVHKLIFVIPLYVPLNSMKTYTFSYVFKTWHRKPQRKHSLCFTEYISKIRIFILKICQIFFRQMSVFMQCICQSFPLPKFPSIRYIQ